MFSYHSRGLNQKSTDQPTFSEQMVSLTEQLNQFNKSLHASIVSESIIQEIITQIRKLEILGTVADEEAKAKVDDLKQSYQRLFEEAHALLKCIKDISNPFSNLELLGRTKIFSDCSSRYEAGLTKGKSLGIFSTLSSELLFIELFCHFSANDLFNLRLTSTFFFDVLGQLHFDFITLNKNDKTILNLQSFKKQYPTTRPPRLQDVSVAVSMVGSNPLALFFNFIVSRNRLEDVPDLLAKQLLIRK